jgi:subfamily B ATP-binding cassette protein MsbA
VNPLSRLFGYARPYRGRLAAALTAMLFYAAASAAVAYLIKPLLDNVLQPNAARDALLSGQIFFGWSIQVLGAYTLKGGGAYLSTFLMTDVGQRVVRDLRDRLFRHILDQSAGFFTRHSSGSLMSHITNDVNQVQQAVSETVGDLTREDSRSSDSPRSCSTWIGGWRSSWSRAHRSSYSAREVRQAHS